MSTAEIPIQIALDANSNGLRFTPDEFDDVTEYDPNYRYELIDGVVVVNPIPSEAEADPNETLGVFLGIYRRQHPGGGVGLWRPFVGSRRKGRRHPVPARAP